MWISLKSTILPIIPWHGLPPEAHPTRLNERNVDGRKLMIERKVTILENLDFMRLCCVLFLLSLYMHLMPVFTLKEIKIEQRKTIQNKCVS